MSFTFVSLREHIAASVDQPWNIIEIQHTFYFCLAPLSIFLSHRTIFRPLIPQVSPKTCSFPSVHDCCWHIVSYDLLISFHYVQYFIELHKSWFEHVFAHFFLSIYFSIFTFKVCHFIFTVIRLLAVLCVLFVVVLASSLSIRCVPFMFHV